MKCSVLGVFVSASQPCSGAGLCHGTRGLWGRGLLGVGTGLGATGAKLVWGARARSKVLPPTPRHGQRDSDGYRGDRSCLLPITLN